VRQAERAFTWTLLAFCVAYALGATAIDMRLGQHVNAAAFPLAAAVFTAVPSVMLLVASRRARDLNARARDLNARARDLNARASDLTPRARDLDRPADIGRTEVLFTAMGFAYWLSLPWLGYVVATSLFLLVGTLSLGERVSLRPFVVSIATAAALWVVFVFLLGVPLPDLPLGFD
jgi:Tripartite tricarboxylate transporter TctB family